MSAILDITSGITDNATVVERLANRLRIARAHAGLSQEQLAQRVGVTRQTISSIENGVYGPSALLAFQLARELGKSVEEIFYVEEDSR